MPHISWNDQFRSLFGVKTSLHSLHKFTQACPPMMYIGIDHLVYTSIYQHIPSYTSMILAACCRKTPGIPFLIAACWYGNASSIQVWNWLGIMWLVTSIKSGKKVDAHTIEINSQLLPSAQQWLLIWSLPGRVSSLTAWTGLKRKSDNQEGIAAAVQSNHD